MSSGIRFAKATVNNVKGVILLPDNWAASIYTLNSTNGGNYSGNIITIETWNIVLEANGAVFLPAAGYRNGTAVSYVGEQGCYWSASFSDSSDVWRLYFESSNVFPNHSISRYRGHSVRLVRDAQ